jgi:hypothetical protein
LRLAYLKFRLNLISFQSVIDDHFNPELAIENATKGEGSGMAAITIRGKLGSGAPEIGALVAQRTHMDFIDRKLIGDVATLLPFHEKDLVLKLVPASNIRHRIGQALKQYYPGMRGLENSYLPMSDLIDSSHDQVETMTALIRNLVDGPPAVFYGRGSQFILKNYPPVMRVSITAPLDLRVQRVMRGLKISEKNARHQIALFDRGSNQYLKKHFGANMEDPAYYDIVINTQKLNLEDSTSLIIGLFLASYR